MTCFLRLATLVSLSVVASTAHATLDAKTFPGAMCMEQNLNSITLDSRGRAMNTDADEMTWVCPIVREWMSGTLSSASVYVLDQHHTDDVSCTLYSHTTGGSSTDYASGSTSGTSGSAKTSSISSLGASTNGYYYLLCTVPGTYSGNMSGVVSYHVKESYQVLSPDGVGGAQ